MGRADEAGGRADPGDGLSRGLRREPGGRRLGGQGAHAGAASSQGGRGEKRLSSLGEGSRRLCRQPRGLTHRPASYIHSPPAGLVCPICSA